MTSVSQIWQLKAKQKIIYYVLEKAFGNYKPTRYGSFSEQNSEAQTPTEETRVPLSQRHCLNVKYCSQAHVLSIWSPGEGVVWPGCRTSGTWYLASRRLPLGAGL